MRNVAAGIVIFFIVIFLGSIFFFEITKPLKKGSFEHSSDSVSFSESRHQYVFDYVEGVVQKKTQSDLGWTNIKTKDLIGGDAQIRTKSNSKLVLLFEDGIFLKLGPDTEIQVSFEGGDNARIDLISGSVFSRLDGFDKLNYVFRAGDHEIHSSQNSFIAKRNQDRSVEIVVLEGELTIGEDKHFSFNEKIDIIRGEVSSREILMSDFEEGFVVWSVGEGKVEEMRKWFEEKESNKEEENEGELSDIENNQT